MTPVVSSAAERDLDEIEVWLTQNWGPLAAANIIEAILDGIAGLAEMPPAGAPRQEFGEAVRMAPSGRCAIYYEASDAGLVVLRILHGARDRDAIMGKRQE